MLYELEQGGELEDHIIEASLKRTGRLPEALENAPELAPGLELFYNAFSELDSCRTFGMALGPIPWTAVTEYGRHLGYENGSVEMDRLCRYIRHMDSVFLKHMNKKKSK